MSQTPRYGPRDPAKTVRQSGQRESDPSPFDPKGSENAGWNPGPELSLSVSEGISQLLHLKGVGLMVTLKGSNSVNKMISNGKCQSSNSK